MTETKPKAHEDRVAVGLKLAQLRATRLDPPRNTINAAAADFRVAYRIGPGQKGAGKDTWRYVESGIGDDGEPHKAYAATIARMAAFVGWDPDEALAAYFDPDDEFNTGVPSDARRMYLTRRVAPDSKIFYLIDDERKRISPQEDYF